MDVYLFDQPKFQRLYNCSFYNISQIELSERRHPFWGIFFLVSGVIFTILYIPCLWAMCVSEWRRRTSYKLMIQLGFIQIIGLQIAGVYVGVQSIFGIVFCSNPDFEYISCSIIFWHWIATSTTCDILGLNRLCELYSSNLADKLFGGWKLCLWMAFPVVYGFIMFWYTQTIFFNSYMLAFFSNPHYGYVDDPLNTYLNPMLPVHNISVCLTELVIYIAMPILYFRATRVTSDEFRSKMRYEKQIFFQVICIGLINFSASLTYIVIQFIPTSFATTLSGTIGYLLSQGMSSIVYLTINKSIRQAILTKIGLRSARVYNSSIGQQAERLPSTVNTNQIDLSQGI